MPARDQEAASRVRALFWVGSAQKDLATLPKEVQQELLAAITVAQHGGMPRNAKPLKGLGEGLVEALDDFRGDTFRAVYTIAFPGELYVLHCFRKKSVRGIKTPKPDLDLIKARLKAVKTLVDERARQQKQLARKPRGT